MDSERREYYRVEDQVALTYRVVGEAETELLLEKLQNNLPDRFNAAASFAGTSRQLSHLLIRVKGQNPDLGMCLEALDRKLNLLSELLVTEEVDLEKESTKEVNLSAGGFAFNCHEELKVGDLLETRLVLFPSSTGILALSKVVHCQRLEGSEYGWRIAVEYEEMREPDRDLLCKHILIKQTEERRAAREAQDSY